MAIPAEKLDFWINNRYNVLFVGEHGVGKTAMVLEAFNRAGLNWLYYSASTMDPWVDMIGVPKERQDENGNVYLDLVRPREFQNDEVQALFFDEFNRSHKKIRNAVMELIQFKSINGRKFNNLRVVWAAVNPADDEETYDVERLDPAQEDRFHIKVFVPYKPHLSYFSNKYSKQVARSAFDWWNNLPDAQKKAVSPRRLDYALDVWTKGGDLRDVLPHDSNVSKLITTLQNGPISDMLNGFMERNDMEGARTWLQIENNYAAAMESILKSKYTPFFLPLLPKEKISSLVVKNKGIRAFAMSNFKAHPVLQQVLEEVCAANANTKLAREIKKALPSVAVGVPIIAGKLAIPNLGNSYVQPRYAVETLPSFDKELALYCQKLPSSQTNARWTIVAMIRNGIPKDLSVQSAITVLKILSYIAGSSHVSTILSNRKIFFEPFNYALKVLYASGVSWEGICKDQKAYPIGQMLQKAAQSKQIASAIMLDPKTHDPLSPTTKDSVVNVQDWSFGHVVFDPTLKHGPNKI